MKRLFNSQISGRGGEGIHRVITVFLFQDVFKCSFYFSCLNNFHCLKTEKTGLQCIFLSSTEKKGIQLPLGNGKWALHRGWVTRACQNLAQDVVGKALCLNTKLMSGWRLVTNVAQYTTCWSQTQSFSVNCCKNAVYKSHKIPSYQDNPVTRS